MTVTALSGMPLVRMGAMGRNGNPSLASFNSITVDAANEAAIYIGYVITEDGASHTIDTTGSSSLGWRTGAATFANAGTTVLVGLAAVDTTAGPPARAVNVTDVITFDVAASFTGGGGGITGNAWQTSVPTTGTKTIANGDFVAFAVQATARAGADTIGVSQASDVVSNQLLPCVTSFVGAAYADTTRLPNVVITFSDGKLGFFAGGFVATVAANTQTWNSGSATKEYGNYFLAPFPINIYGLYLSMNLTANADLVLYSDPLGTPVAQKTVALDLNSIASSNNLAIGIIPFPAPYVLAANTPCAAIVKPGGSNVTMLYKTYDAAAHQKSDHFGSDGYAINRASGAFAAQNSNKDRFPIGLLVGAFDNGTGAGGPPQLVNGQGVVG